VWFFGQIARFGSPLIVWTHSAARHREFLETAQPSPTLTFLLLYGAKPEQPTLMELLDENRIEDALTECSALPEACGDEQLYAAYFICIRSEQADRAPQYVARVKSRQQRLLLMGNYLSRNPGTAFDARLMASVGPFAAGDVPRTPEDFYWLAMHVPEGEATLRESGSAKHEMAYALHARGQTEKAEVLLRGALADIEASGKDSSAQQDVRWYTALATTLRDWADLLADEPERLEEATPLLQRAKAIQAFHGMRVALAYSTTTEARLALAGARYTQAIDLAVEAANRFVRCNNWRGWFEAHRILFDSLAETRETARMMSVAKLAREKLQLSNLPEARREEHREDLAFQRARAHWIAGELAEAREELQELREAQIAMQKKLDPKVERLYEYLDLSPATHDGKS
jgi:hypothetical protein